MDENDPASVKDLHEPCPGCGGRGHYRLTPVGDVLCPECGGTGRRPAGMMSPSGSRRE